MLRAVKVGRPVAPPRGATVRARLAVSRREARQFEVSVGVKGRNTEGSGPDTLVSGPAPT